MHRGLRASQTVAEATSHLTWDKSAGLPLLLNDDQNSYIYGPGGMPIAHISSGEAPTSSGNATGAFTYEAYGSPAGSSGTQTTPLGYAGQYTNSESGLQYLRAPYVERRVERREERC